MNEILEATDFKPRPDTSKPPAALMCPQLKMRHQLIQTSLQVVSSKSLASLRTAIATIKTPNAIPGLDKDLLQGHQFSPNEGSCWTVSSQDDVKQTLEPWRRKWETAMTSTGSGSGCTVDDA